MADELGDLDDVAATAQLGALVAQTLVELLVRKGVMTIPDAVKLFQVVEQRALALGGPHNEAVAKTAASVAESYPKMQN